MFYISFVSCSKHYNILNSCNHAEFRRPESVYNLQQNFLSIQPMCLTFTSLGLSVIILLHFCFKNSSRLYIRNGRLQRTFVNCAEIQVYIWFKFEKNHRIPLFTPCSILRCKYSSWKDDQDVQRLGNHSIFGVLVIYIFTDISHIPHIHVRFMMTLAVT